jgi:hypothetical protein
MKVVLERRWGNESSYFEKLHLFKQVVQTSKDQKKMWQNKYRRPRDSTENKLWTKPTRYKGFLNEYISMLTDHKSLGLHIRIRQGETSQI